MRFIKFDENGKNAQLAPHKKVSDSGTIYGYDTISNSGMLAQDGYIIDENTCPLTWLTLTDGQIQVEEPEQPVVLPTTFSKLQIRRCLRKHRIRGCLEYSFEYQYGVLK